MEVIKWTREISELPSSSWRDATKGHEQREKHFGSLHHHRPGYSTTVRTVQSNLRFVPHPHSATTDKYWLIASLGTSCIIWAWNRYTEFGQSPKRVDTNYQSVLNWFQPRPGKRKQDHNRWNTSLSLIYNSNEVQGMYGLHDRSSSPL